MSMNDFQSINLFVLQGTHTCTLHLTIDRGENLSTISECCLGLSSYSLLIYPKKKQAPVSWLCTVFFIHEKVVLLNNCLGTREITKRFRLAK